MPVTPDTLPPAAAWLYQQCKHLEIGDPDTGRSAEDLGWPWATVCRALTAPIEPLYALVAMTMRPWEAAFDVDAAPGFLLPWLSFFFGVELPQGISDDDARLRLKTADARKRGTITSMVQRAVETLAPGGLVYFRERDGSAYRITMAVYASADPTLTVQRVTEVKAGGLVLELSVETGPTYGLARVGYTSYADVLARRATYAAFRDTLPS